MTKNELIELAAKINVSNWITTGHKKEEERQYWEKLNAKSFKIFTKDELIEMIKNWTVLELSI